MPKENLVFHYFKSNTHSEIKVDGALGGVSPSGDAIFVSVYTERAPIPQKVTFEWNDDGSLGDEKVDEREGLEGVVRSVETTLHMTPKQARSLHQWLGDQIDTLESFSGEEE